MEGVDVMRIAPGGSIHRSFLTLSEEKFSLYMTTSKMSGSNRSGRLGAGSMKFGRVSLLRGKSAGSSTSTYESSEQVIDVGSVDRIQKGQLTYKFEVALKGKEYSADAKHLADPNRSFSIVYLGSRTLDLIIPTNESRDTIVNALEKLIQAYQKARASVSNELLMLRYAWVDVDKVRWEF